MQFDRRRDLGPPQARPHVAIGIVVVLVVIVLAALFLIP